MFKLIIYIYNHKSKHNATNRIPADIFMYAGSPEYNTQARKTRKKLTSGSRSLYTLSVIIIKFKNTKNDIPNSIR